MAMKFMLALSMLELAVAFQPPVLGGPHRGMRLRAASQKPCALEMQSGLFLPFLFLRGPLRFSSMCVRCMHAAGSKMNQSPVKRYRNAIAENHADFVSVLLKPGAPVDRRTLLAAPVSFALASLSVPAPVRFDVWLRTN